MTAIEAKSKRSRSSCTSLACRLTGFSWVKQATPQGMLRPHWNGKCGPLKFLVRVGGSNPSRNLRGSIPTITGQDAKLPQYATGMRPANRRTEEVRSVNLRS